MIAVPDAVVFLIVVLIDGFGFGYKVVSIILALPLATILAGQQSRLSAYSGLVVTAFIMIPSVISYSILLTWLYSPIAAGFIRGSSGLLVGVTPGPRPAFFEKLQATPRNAIQQM